METPTNAQPEKPCAIGFRAAGEPAYYGHIEYPHEWDTGLQRGDCCLYTRIGPRHFAPAVRVDDPALLELVERRGRRAMIWSEAVGGWIPVMP